MKRTRMKSYLRRNVQVAKACGVKEGIKAILQRWRNPPIWARKILTGALARQKDVIAELVLHRDEFSPYRAGLMEEE